MASTEPDQDVTPALGEALPGPASAGKLVRDKIPQIIRSKGHEPVTHIAGDGEYRARLRDKLREETGEYLASGDPQELADILEVLYALAGQAGVSGEQLEMLRAAKAEERGGFTGRVIWFGNRSGTEPDAAERAALGEALAAPAMRRYRKRPVEVETLEWAGSNLDAIRAFAGPVNVSCPGGGDLAIWNDQERAYIPCPPGHSVVKGKLNEFYPISPAAIAATYEPADSESRDPVQAERERIAQVAEDLGAHYHERLERTRGRSASFADFLRGASAGKTAGEEPA